VRDASDLAIVIERWPDVVDQISTTKPFLRAALTTARPIRVEGDTLLVDFGTAIHRRRAEAVANRRAIQDAIGQALSRHFHLKCVVGSNTTGPSLFEDPVITFAVRKFGGEPRRMG
jgi:hypothetical protein